MKLDSNFSAVESVNTTERLHGLDYLCNIFASDDSVDRTVSVARNVRKRDCLPWESKGKPCRLPVRFVPIPAPATKLRAR